MEKPDFDTLIKNCTTRTHLITALVDTWGYDSYLEIGCRTDETFKAVKCTRKTGVDPIEGGTHRMTSDEFFVQNAETFDIIFIDGDHWHEQVLRDAENSLACLNPGGIIVMHDCAPPSASYEGKRNHKCGTAWRAFAHLRQRTDLDMCVANWDYGSGLVRRGHNSFPVTLGKTMDELTFANYEEHRDDWMRLMDQEHVASWLQKKIAQSILR